MKDLTLLLQPTPFTHLPHHGCQSCHPDLTLVCAGPESGPKNGWVKHKQILIFSTLYLYVQCGVKVR